MKTTVTSEVERLLGALEMQDFEDEVCALLANVLLDFQEVPAAQGDAGFDGLSHDFTVGYCCYGPKQSAAKKKASADYKDDILEKFRKDMRRVFELEPDGSKRLKRVVNDHAEKVMPKGKRVKHLRLCVSIFSQKDIIGPLATSFDEYKQTSTCRFVEKLATMNIVGPKQIAGLGCDDRTLLRLQQRFAASNLRDVLDAATPPPSGTVTTMPFEDKFAWLEKAAASSAQRVRYFAEKYLKAWFESVKLDDHFANNSVDLHRKLIQVRDEATHESNVVSMAAGHDSNAALQSLLGVRAAAKSQAHKAFGETAVDPDLIDRIADGETGRMIGECHMDWRKT